MLDESCNLLLDTDGVGNALASILEDSKLQVSCCSFHVVLKYSDIHALSHSLDPHAHTHLRCRATKTLLSTLSVIRPQQYTEIPFHSPTTHFLGILTAGARDGWAKCREKLCSLAPANAQVCDAATEFAAAVADERHRAST